MLHPHPWTINKAQNWTIKDWRSHVVLPRSFFEVYLNMKGASCLTVSFRDKVIGYGFGIEYGNNLYASWGGVDPSYFSLHPSHRLFDALIQHAAERNLNIHFGLGIHGSGHGRFKTDCGCVLLKTERFPDDRRFMSAMIWASQFSLWGRILSMFSRRWPAKMAFQLLPTT